MSQPLQPSADRRPRAPAAGSLPEQVLAHAQAGREVIQDFVPLAASLEWSLGQEGRRKGHARRSSVSQRKPYRQFGDSTDRV